MMIRARSWAGTRRRARLRCSCIYKRRTERETKIGAWIRHTMPRPEKAATSASRRLGCKTGVGAADPPGVSDSVCRRTRHLSSVSGRRFTGRLSWLGMKTGVFRHRAASGGFQLSVSGDARSRRVFSPEMAQTGAEVRYTQRACRGMAEISSRSKPARFLRM